MRLRWLILAFLLIPLVGGAWVYVAFWSLVLLSALAVTLSFRRMAAIGRVAAAEAGGAGVGGGGDAGGGGEGRGVVGE